MLGIIERALSQIDYHIKRLNTFLWCFHFPIAITAGIGLTLYSETRIPWVWGGIFVLCAISYASTKHDISNKFLPEKKHLEALRQKLLEGEQKG